jgi:Protein of unknown function (DUF2630)
VDREKTRSGVGRESECRIPSYRRNEEALVEDPQIHGAIDRMVEEEHELWQRESAGVATDGDRQRLAALRVSLDQCWDLLRQRRARRDAGQDPEGAELRSSEVVEHYEQ